MKYAIKTERDIYKGSLFSLRQAVISYNGKSFKRENVVHPGAVVIITQTNDGKIILVKQFRYSARQELWELPAGTLGKGEKPLDCAKRELAEETGFKAESFRKLSRFYPCPGYSSEILHLYLAKKLSPTYAVPDEDENIKTGIFSRAQIENLLKKGKIVDAKTIIGLMLWLKK
ncbi:MAG: NUDIX hydrolase [Planctomycetes bacterium]|nr:NUDIX hydrolase [Planctomycetota bacterium]